MAKPKQKNIVERLTGVGEEAIQRIGGAPGADKVLAALGSLPKRVDELQRSVRGLEKLGFQRDHVSTDDRGELVWLTRALG